MLIFTLALALGVLCAWKEERPVDRILCKVGHSHELHPGVLALARADSRVLRWRCGGCRARGAYAVGGWRLRRPDARILMLPMTVVVLSHLWYYAYMLRNKLLEEVRADYVLLGAGEGAFAAHDPAAALSAQRVAVVSRA